MKKFISLALALVMALSLTTAAWGAVAPTDVAKIGDTGYATLQDAVNNANGKTVVMLDNVTDNTALQIPENTNVTLDMNGKTFTSMDGGSGNWMAIKVNRGATLTLIGNGKIVASCYGVYVQPGATFNLVSGSIEVSGNGTYDYAVVVWNATFNMSGGSLEGQECVHTSNYWADNGETGIPTSTVSITSGSLEATGANPATIVTEGAKEIIVTGGTFSDDAAEDYVAPGYSFDPTTGAVATTVAGGAADSTLYFWDNATAKWLVDFVATGKTLDKLAQDSSDDCLPCYLINGEYFIEVKEAAATFKLVYGNKTVFLSPVAEEDVHYDYKASALTVVDEDDAECGDWYIANLDEDDKYYISYTKKGEVDGVFVAEKNGSVQLLVGGKIVDAEVAGISFMFHDFKGYDVVNYQYTTVKCAECGKVAKLYANATAATVGKKDAVKIDTLGWITFADYMDFGANAPVVTDKVTSAETFDAGIAMYVGMSVMAAAGSAVVIGKKKD